MGLAPARAGCSPDGLLPLQLRARVRPALLPLMWVASRGRREKNCKLDKDILTPTTKEASDRPLAPLSKNSKQHIKTADWKA